MGSFLLRVYKFTYKLISIWHFCICYYFLGVLVSLNWFVHKNQIGKKIRHTLWYFIPVTQHPYLQLFFCCQSLAVHSIVSDAWCASWHFSILSVSINLQVIEENGLKNPGFPFGSYFLLVLMSELLTIPKIMTEFLWTF